MALLKCESCGANLNIVKGSTIIECEYCNTWQTTPKELDENLENLYNRANFLRLKGEFDKAESVYEKIILNDNTQSVAYWGLILCKFGIEYVNDPKTSKKIPTCHRTSYDSIIADENYKAAIKNADNDQRKIYETQAKEIDRIQKEILSIAQKEEAYDVFICYKETDENGQRTKDSIIADDIYYQLTNEGFKVFYAAITLDSKLGSAYEPIIFAALNSAKVMLAIGTKPEYFNAVWVKNEWSRYLKIIQKDRSKQLIPCYRDMDAYELPEEFAHLQAQDMSKIGFINNVVRGIKEILNKNESKATPVIKEIVVQNTNNNVEPLLKRVNLFLESKDWHNASSYCDRVLDIEPENVQAYIYKLLSELQISNEETLKSLYSPIEQMTSYKMALRFADTATSERLKQYSYIINNNIIRQREETERRTNLAQQHNILTNNVSTIANKLKELEEKEARISEKVSSNTAELTRAKKALTKTLIYFISLIIIWTACIISCVKVGSDISAGIVIFLVFSMLSFPISSFLIFKANGYQISNALLTTFGLLFTAFIGCIICPFVYIIKNSITIRECKECIIKANKKLQELFNEINKTKQSLNIAKEKLDEFERITKI